MGGSFLFYYFHGFKEFQRIFGRLQIEHLFINLRFFVISGLLILSILPPQPDFHGLVWMLLSFVIGNIFLIGVLRWGRFETDNGFMILAFIMLELRFGILLFKTRSNISLLCFTISIATHSYHSIKVDNWKLYCLGATFLMSNFFPPLNTNLGDL